MGQEKKHSGDIKIDIDNLRARKIVKDQENHFFIYNYAEKIKNLINIRIKEFEKNSGYGDFQEYFEYKMNDSILIYGTRGNGKTTIMMNLKELLQDLDKIKVLEIVDPTLLEEEEDFLLIILKSLYNEVVENENFDRSDNDKKNFEKDLENILEQIEGTRVKEKSIEIFDKFYNHKTGVNLAKSIHKLFYIATKIFKVQTIIIPIDDIDMNMYQGYKISETIRKYLSSPYIIPIVTFNLKQMNAIIKKNKFNAFGLDMQKSNISKMDDLDFLLSLPSDYLTAIFPPNRRIYLDSIYEILEKEFKKEDNGKRKILLVSEKLQAVIKKDTIKLRAILGLFMELVFEKKLPKDITRERIDDYLSNRSIRDFLYDMLSIVNSLDKKSKQDIISKQNILKERFSPENQNLLVNKEQALSLLWDEFLNLAKSNINKQDIKDRMENDWIKIITNVNYNDYSELVNKKIYKRLWLQHFYYPNKTEIKYEEEKFNVEKNFSIAGFLELCLRSFIPMHLFKEIVFRHNIDYSLQDIMRLKEMAKADLMDVAYHISVMELFLKQHATDKEDLRSNAKIFGSINVNYRKNELYEAKWNIPYLFKLRKQDLFFEDNNENSKQIYFFSIFKSLALLISSLKILEKYKIEKKKIKEKDSDEKSQKEKELDIQLKRDFKKLYERNRVNLPCENCNNFVSNYVKSLEIDEYTKPNDSNTYLDKLESIIDIGSLNNSELGILEAINFSKRLIKFFYEIRANINLEDNFSSLNFTINAWKKEEKYIFIKSMKDVDSTDVKDKDYIYAEGTLSDYFKFPLTTYLTGFFQSLFISLIETQQDLKHLDIYTINSTHGADLTLLKEKELSVRSNAFISNISYLLSGIDDEEVKKKISKKLQDKKEKMNDSDKELLKGDKENEKVAKSIIEFYENFLSIDYYEKLMENFSKKEPTEDCNFLGKEKQQCL